MTARLGPAHLVAAVAAVSLLVVACGGDDSEDSDSTSAAATAAAETDPTAEADGATDSAVVADSSAGTSPSGEDVVPVCDLISAESVEAAFGGAPSSVSPPVEGAVNPGCVWSFETSTDSASLGLLHMEFPTPAEAEAFLDQQVTGAQFSPVPYDGLGDQAVVVDGDTGIRVAARQGAVVLDLTAFAVGRTLPSLDVCVGLMEEALGNL